MKLPSGLEKLRVEKNPYASMNLPRLWDEGFTACAEILLPLVEELKTTAQRAPCNCDFVFHPVANDFKCSRCKALESARKVLWGEG